MLAEEPSNGGGAACFTSSASSPTCSRLARAGAPPERQACTPLREVVADVVHDLGRRRVEDVACDIAVEEMPECTLACPPGVLTSILLNLVGNPIKHMPRESSGNTVLLRGNKEGRRVQRRGGRHGGPRASSGRPSRLFQPYVRVNVGQPGLGLGLATVRRLVEAHGGNVGARSNDGPGAVFWFDLPATHASA